MDYLPSLIGLRIGSEKFRQAIEGLQAELIEAGYLDEMDTLTTTYGNLRSLIANQTPGTEGLVPTYPEEDVLLITRSSDGSRLYLKRVVEVEPKGKSRME